MLQLPDTKVRLMRMDSEPGTLSAEALGDFIKAELTKWHG